MHIFDPEGFIQRSPNKRKTFHTCVAPVGILLVQWLYPKILQETLNKFMAIRNGARMRKDKDKAGPSGCSRDEAFSCYREWGGKNYLRPVDVRVVQGLKKHLGGEKTR
jgi:hypothetical protein